MNFYKVNLVVEADNSEEAHNLIEQIIDESKTNDVWFKKTEEMTDDEILDFFDRTKEEMTNEDEE